MLGGRYTGEGCNERDSSAGLRAGCTVVASDGCVGGSSHERRCLEPGPLYQ